MKKAYLSLIDNAIKSGFTVSVYDGECWDVKRSSSYKTIKDSIESVEVAELRIRDSAGNVVGWAQIIPDLDPGETVADYTYTKNMCALVGDTFKI